MFLNQGSGASDVKRWSSTVRQVAGRPLVLAAAVLVLGVVVSVGLALLTRSAERRDATAANDRRTAAVAQAVRHEVARYSNTVQALAAGIGSHQVIDDATFGAITGPTVGAHLPGGASLYYTVPVRTGGVAAAQAYWRRHGSDGLVLRPAGTEREHVMVVLGRPLDGRPASLGADMAQLPEPTQAMAEARRTGDVAVSNAYHLYKDRSLPAARQQMSFIITTPVYAPTDRYGRPGPFRGWMVLSLRSGNLLTAVLKDLSQGLINVSLSATTSDGRPLTVASLRTGHAGADRPITEAAVPAGDKQWRLRVQATDLDSRLRSPLVSVVMVRGVFGSVLSVLFAGLIFRIATSREREAARVRTAIAETQRAEADARQHSNLLEAIMNSISDGVNVVDGDGRYLLRNPAGLRILGTRDDRDATGPLDPKIRQQFFKPDGITPYPAAELPLMRALAGEPVDQAEMVVRSSEHPSGLVINASSRPLMSGDRQIGAVVAFRDVTAQKRTAEKLAEANERLSSELVRREATEMELRGTLDELADQKARLAEVLDALQVAVTTCDTDGVVVHRNATGQKWGPGLSEGTSLRDFAAQGVLTDVRGEPITLEQLPLHRSLTHEVVVDQELLAHEKQDTGPRYVMVHSRPLHDALGRTVGAVSSAYDVTALREREAELRDFAGAVAHDLKGPLSAVIGHLEIVTDIITADGSQLPERLARSLDRANGGAQRMSQLITDLLDYVTARDATIRLAPVDLGSLVEKIVEERTDAVRAVNGAPVPDIFCGPLPAVVADARMLRQVIDNMVGNAIKYSAPGERARIDISAHLMGAQVRIDIADRGIGIPPGERDKVFNTFHRAHQGKGYTGTGLGLAICKRIIERHGGTIGVEENPGGGSRFYFTVPAAGDPAPPTAPAGRAKVSEPR